MALSRTRTGSVTVENSSWAEERHAKAAALGSSVQGTDRQESERRLCILGYCRGE